MKRNHHSILYLPSGERSAILEHTSGQKWFGCTLTAQSSKLHHVDVKHPMQQPSRAFFANRWILQDHQESNATGLKYFDKVVITVACFAVGHWTVYKNDLVKMDVSYRKLCQQIVGPPRGTNSAFEGHEAFHFCGTNGHNISLHGAKTWSQSLSLLEIRKVWGVPPFDRWVKRIFAWTPPWSRNSGRPPNSWDQMSVQKL